MPTNRSSIYFDPDQPLLMRHWLDERGIKYHYAAGLLRVQFEDGWLTGVQPHDIITHVNGRDWVEVFAGDGNDEGVHCAPAPKE